MRDFPTESIRNISIIGDHGDGKTSTAEGKKRIETCQSIRILLFMNGIII
ncbi:hypothetical protein MYX76_10395 [Desulfobacterota bacterium AH_259_B03_O07]|nr:hypothetical protein [Desulfobacterota bacterium AH_259_B03_O07]